MLHVPRACIIQSLQHSIAYYGAMTLLTRHGVTTTLQVEPKSEDCLYQDIEVSSKVKTNVLVTRGGKLDIKYRVCHPSPHGGFETAS